MSKILFISNIAKRVGSFSVASIEAAHRNGLDFYMAANWTSATEEQLREDEHKYNVKIINIDLARSPYSPKNITAYKQLVEFIKKENIDYIHCNTPVGGLLGRLAGKKCKVKKVIYQAHGFHFYKGAPLKNWLIYYPIERWLAHYTDALITINKEDYERAQGFKLRKNGKVYYVPGVGIDLSQYELPESTREIKREELGLKETDVALISMGDLIDRKNYPVAIEVVAKANNPSLQYFICGKGPEEDKLKKMAEDLGVKEQIHFLGFRTDIKELLKAADIFLFTSKQEGLARSLMEAMASGLPCVASRIRGNTDILSGTEGGFLCEVDDVETYAEKINLLVKAPQMRESMGKNAMISVHNFSTKVVVDELGRDYAEIVRVWGGVTLEEFYPMWAKKRIELCIPLDAFVLISVGELNVNKNNKVIIEALEKLQNQNIHYCLCGVGNQQNYLQTQADNAGLHDNVHFLGYRSDVKDLLLMADVYVMPSIREGLSRSLMEAMACGLPCIVSDIRGNRDLINGNKCGYLCSTISEYADAINQLLIDECRTEWYRSNCLNEIRQYSSNIVNEKLHLIYRQVFDNDNKEIVVEGQN